MMKKILSVTLALALTFVLLPATAVANAGITVTVHGEAIAFDGQGPVIVNDRTLVPVAGVFQALGFSTQWDGETRQVTITRDDEVIVITIDSSTFTTNGTERNLDVRAQIIGGRTMLPIATVLRSVGYDVGWDGATRTVVITGESPEAAPAPPADAGKDEAETAAPPADNGLAGAWLWLGNAFYVFEADGSGLMTSQAINWEANNGVLGICITPERCTDGCTAPVEWYYVVDGDELALTSRLMPDMSYTYTRR